MPGNRDFLMGEALAGACGAVLLDDPERIELAGRPCVLSHGDALCTADVEYIELRRMPLRSPEIDRRPAGPAGGRARGDRHRGPQALAGGRGEPARADHGRDPGGSGRAARRPGRGPADPRPHPPPGDPPLAPRDAGACPGDYSDPGPGPGRYAEALDSEVSLRTWA
ncbi:MAG: hypothetical protein U5R48_06570 [Gammaproteobacteria bacterium]|nr:hypothetical protein [Gammaproteobacteria bacterium]